MFSIRGCVNSILGKKNIVLLYLLVFVSYSNISMPYPIFAPIFLQNPSYSLSNNHSLNMFLLGVMLACYPFGQLIGSPFVGKLSDSLNRKNMLVFMLIGSALSYFLTGLAFYYHKLFYIFFLRMLTGIFESSIVIVQTLLTDVCAPHLTKTKIFSYFYVMCTLGFIIGPLFGGIGAGNAHIAFFGISTPFYFASFITIFFSILISIKLTASERTFDSIQHIEPTTDSNFSDNFQFIIFFSWLCFLGIDMFLSFSPVYLVAKWHFGIHNLTIYSLYLAFLLVFCQGYLLPLLSETYNPQQLLSRSLILITVTLGTISLPFINITAFIFLLPLISLSISTLTTSLTLIVSNKSTKSTHGKALGLLRLSRAGGDTLVCLVSGGLAAFLPALPIILATLIFLISFSVLSLRIYFKKGF